MSIFEEEPSDTTLQLLQEIKQPEFDLNRLQTLVSSGAELNPACGTNVRSPLLAVLYQSLQPRDLFSFVEFLVRHGADVNLADEKGMTPLTFTVLHVNHGLRYYKPAAKMLDRPTSDEEWVQLDALFQACISIINGNECCFI